MKTASLTFKNEEFEQLLSEIAADATYVNFCQVRYVGSNLTSRTMVSVFDDQKQYLSEWPEWAFQLAKEALLANHKLLVIADDAPFGQNIRQLYLMNRDFPK